MKNAFDFRDMLKPELQVAMGLETVHPEILRKLNKRMTLEDFENTVKFLTGMNSFKGIYFASAAVSYLKRKVFMGRTVTRFCLQGGLNVAPLFL